MTSSLREEVRERGTEVLLADLCRREPQADLVAEVLRRLATEPGTPSVPDPVPGRTPLLVAALIVLGIGVTCYIAWTSPPEATPQAGEPRQDRPLPPVLAVGVEALAKLPADTRNLQVEGMSDAAVQGLARFSGLRRLVLWKPRSEDPVAGGGFSKAGLARICAMPGMQSLEELRIQHSSLDGGLAALQRLPRLRRLAITDSRIDDRDLDDLIACPTLQHLEIGPNTGISGHGRGLIALERMPRLTHLSLAGLDWLDDRELLRLGRMRGLRALNLTEVDGRESVMFSGLERPGVKRGVTDRVLAALAKLPELHTLTLNGIQNLGDAQLRLLGDAPKLRRLHLAFCGAISSEGFAALPAGMLELGLSGTRITPAQLRRFTALEHAEIGDCAALQADQLSALIEGGWGKMLHTVRLQGSPPLSDADLRAVAGLPRLRNLDLSLNRWVLDAHLQPLEGLRGRLESLSLVGCRALSPAFFAQLRGFERLRRIELDDTQLDAEDQARLQGMLPQCHLEIFGSSLTQGARRRPRRR